MSYWSVYVSEEDNGLLKRELEKIARKNRWSFSQAITGVLREHLVEEKKLPKKGIPWETLAAQSFFEGYPERDSIYDQI